MVSNKDRIKEIKITNFKKLEELILFSNSDIKYIPIKFEIKWIEFVWMKFDKNFEENSWLQGITVRTFEL